MKLPKPQSRSLRFLSPRSPAGVLLLVSALVAPGCGRSHTQKASPATNLPPAQVRIEVIHPRALPVIQEVVGTVRTRHAAEIAAKTSGRILELPVVLGQTVKQGSLLVAIDSKESQARVAQAEVALHQAEIDFCRIDSLHQNRAATASELDAASTRLQTARAAAAEAHALLDHTRVTAPFDGVVAHKQADRGDLAMPGQLLLRIEDPTHLRFEADVPNSLLGRIRPGDTLSVRVDGLETSLNGRVTELAPVADPVTRSLRVRLDLPQTLGLRPGQFGRLAVPAAEGQSLIVPTQAIVKRGQLDLLFVAVDDKAQMRIVRPGRARSDGIEILAGLQPGESVVVENAAVLMDGQPLVAP